MRNDAYLRRKNLDPHKFWEKSRYVTNRLTSHNRPVEKKLSTNPVDNPETRGVTMPYEK
jgi:hypothetical protein